VRATPFPPPRRANEFQRLIQFISALAMKKITLLGFVLLMTQGADRQHIAHHVYRDVL